MATTPLTLRSSNKYTLPFPSSRISPPHFNKHLVCTATFPLSPKPHSLTISTRPSQHSLFFSPTSTPLPRPLNCTLSDSQAPLIESLKTAVSKLTPIDVCKWCGVAALAIAVSKSALNVVFNPFFWVYFSWAWMFWPWYVAIGIGAYGIHCFRKFYSGDANVIEQLGLVTSVFTWITLVPPAFFNGYVDGWPVVFFLVYHYFVLFNATVRKRLYGDTCLRPHDPKWDVAAPALHRLLFCIGVVAAHWGAAFEGPELIRLLGGWYNGFVWGLIMLTIFMQYHATFFLAKYSEKVVVPSVVVRFGPYRWVRHPMYASTMLLFLSYFAALQAPVSAVCVAVVCVAYYNQKAVLEEALLMDEFGESYAEYKKEVPYKFIPFVY